MSHICKDRMTFQTMMVVNCIKCCTKQLLIGLAILTGMLYYELF